MKLTHLKTMYINRADPQSNHSHFIAVLLGMRGLLRDIAGKCVFLRKQISFAHLLHGAAYFCAFMRKTAGSCAKGTMIPSNRANLGVERGVAG